MDIENIPINKQESLIDKKISLGQFFTKCSLWLLPQVREFIFSSNQTIAYDPFAGGGDLLSAVKDISQFNDFIGLDIDPSLSWKINDSLNDIPHVDNAIIITNPPYLAKHSATRKKIDLDKYFTKTSYDDLYLLALDKMLSAQKYVVAIIPESFINSTYLQKNKLSSITILENNPFEDTENPVCVACFDSNIKSLSKIKIYKNDKFINDYQSIENLRLEPQNNLSVTFNDKKGWLGLRAIDSTDDKTFIHFDFKENIKYDWDNKIKISSRHFSLINLTIDKSERQTFIDYCNSYLKKIREESSDILLTPFMGNTKSGIRRRRLDFRLARAIIEKSYLKTINNGEEQLQLF